MLRLASRAMRSTCLEWLPDPRLKCFPYLALAWYRDARQVVIGSPSRGTLGFPVMAENVSTVIAFWSYAHEDDRADQGAILRLADRLRDEYSLLTGQEITLFVDRDDLLWGQEWRERIRTALVQTTFFIPLLSPRYFQRTECRAELLDFAGQAQGLGVIDLIMPILYSPVLDLTDRNPDEAVALAARMQYADWTKIRLRDESSEVHRQAVHALAERLQAVECEVAGRQLVREGQAAGSTSPKLGLSETLREIQNLLPEWLDAVETDPIVDAQSQAIVEEFDEKRRKLTRRQAGARLALAARQAAEMAPLARRELQLAETYTSRTIALNPLVAGAIRGVEAHPELRPALGELEEAVAIAVARIEKPTRGVPMEEWAEARASESRLMGELANIWRRSNRLREETNAIVLRWVASLSTFEAEEA
jgi:TIR domain